MDNFTFGQNPKIEGKPNNRINAINKPIIIESVISIVCEGYINGLESTITDNKKEEWNTKGLNIIPKNITSIEKHALKLEELLLEELLEKLKGYDKVGIMLSGGLDSRIIAGLLKKTEQIQGFEVIVYNWGMDGSRDVVYAKKIANLYNWKYKKLNLNPSVLKENFYHNLKIGCEISPIHLHNMWAVSKDKDSEVVISATFGDSIGRGLFSGKHVKELNSEPILKDYFYLLKPEIKNRYFPKIIKKKLNNSNYIDYISLAENDQYFNYLNRLLQTAMSLIELEKPVVQTFTSKKILEHVLSVPVSQRNDDYYKIILKNLPEGIGYIPNAKTGKSFIEDTNELDGLSPTSHKYGKWLREDLNDFILSNIDFKKIEALGIFDMTNLYFLISQWQKCKEDRSNRIDELMSYLANLSIFIEENDLELPKNNYVEDNNIFKTLTNRFKSILKIKSYVFSRNLLKSK